MGRRLGSVATLVVVSVAVVACTGTPAGSAPPGPVNAPNPGDVAVLVVDDFGYAREGYVGHAGENCTESAGNVVGSSGAGNVVGSGGAGNVVGSGGAGDDVIPPPSPHGELVYEVLAAELTSLLTVNPKPNTVPWKHIPGGKVDDWAYSVNGVAATVRLVPVHTAYYTTGDVIGGIQETIEALTSVGFTRFVLNLSFVVFPCDVDALLDPVSRQVLLDSYLFVVKEEPNVGIALQEYLDKVVAGGSLDLSTVAATAVTEGVRTDARLARLRPYLFGAYYERATRDGITSLDAVVADPVWTAFIAAVRKAGLEVIPVASAGNGIRTAVGGTSYRLGVEFPFAPAVWDSVVAVGADPASVAVNWFNRGEVSHDARALDPKYEGTSFAAPRVSAREAIFLDHVGIAQCDNDIPPLNYIGVPGSASRWANWPELDWPTDVCKDWSI